MKYTEILKLKEMLEEANIPFTFTETYRKQHSAYQIRLGGLADVIQHRGSYGNEQDLLEIMGGLTEEEMDYNDVLGFLTAEEVFKRFKYCWEHQTSVYKEDKNND